MQNSVNYFSNLAFPTSFSISCLLNTFDSKQKLLITKVCVENFG